MPMQPWDAYGVLPYDVLRLTAVHLRQAGWRTPLIEPESGLP